MLSRGRACPGERIPATLVCKGRKGHNPHMDMDVSVTGGSVRGREENGSAVFRGIPYAALLERFGAPRPAEAWEGVREAFEFGSAPPQAGAFGMETLADDGDDWLSINVWSPDLGGGLPVMVWIQGGAYAFGTSGLPEYDGCQLAREGVVVVTFNYRVGLEGFGFIDGTPPNRGLLDQVAALEWVQGNIGAFGGDPGRVTVFGQSAGGGSVAALLAMPRAAGLFHRAIVQSMPGTFFTPGLAADIAEACAAELGLKTADLKGVAPHALPKAGDALIARMTESAERWGQVAQAQIPFAPVIDGDVLPTTPWRGLSGTVDLLVGHTRHEQRLLTALSGMLGQISWEQAKTTAQVFAPDPAAYLEHFHDPEELYEVVRSDWLFRMPSLTLAEAQLAAGGRAHLYELTWPAPGMGGMLGACHGLDVPLVFGNLTVGQPAMLIGEPTAEAEAVSGQMRRAWAGFAASGDPGWPGFDTGATRLFDAVASVSPYPEQFSRDIWKVPPEPLDLIR